MNKRQAVLLTLTLGSVLAVWSILLWHFKKTTLTVDQNKAALVHLCALVKVTDKVWSSAIQSYESLHDRTGAQTRLLLALQRGVLEIRRDETCHQVGVSSTP